jgi:hypothetical protein
MILFCRLLTLTVEVIVSGFCLYAVERQMRAVNTWSQSIRRRLDVVLSSQR